ncbi:MAG: TetR/AcrR family transcriptional regulator [Pseudomonadota bacterium]
MSTTTQTLLDAAEERLRLGGFHAVSFRDLATDLGIKSASVHYHFPKKADLGVAVVERYAERFFDDLDARVDAGEAKILAFIAAYRAALTEKNLPCLCGIMGSEVNGLPEPVQIAVTVFLQRNVDWLESAFSEAGIDEPRSQALHAAAALQGAMLMAANLGGARAFDAVAAEVVSAVRAKIRRAN